MRLSKLLLLCSLSACGDDPAATPGDGADGTTDGADGTTDGVDGGSGGSDSGEPVDWQTLPNACVGAGPDGSDPFTLVGSVKNTESGAPGGWFTEILDLTALPDDGRVVTAGQGGVVVFDITDPTDPVTGDHIAAGDRSFERYYHVLSAEDGLAWATHRDVGLDVLDLTDTGALAKLESFGEKGYEGLARAGDWLYVASTEGFVDVWQVDDPAAPVWRSRVEGLARPWDVAVAGDVAYVADGEAGVVALSLADPAAPVVVGTAPSAGFPIRLVAAGGALYVASGAGGLEIYDLADPLAPSPLAQVDVGGSAQDLTVHDGLVAVTTQEAVVVLDIGRTGRPADPLPFAYEETEQYAMAIDATGDTWAVGDWNILGLWDMGDGPAPALDLGLDIVTFLDGAETLEVSVTNRGGATLDLAGVELPDGLTAQVSQVAIAPGDSARLALTWDGVTSLEGQKGCIASDDPGRPTLQFAVTSGADGEGRVIGMAAPDFSLRDLDGTTHRLSEQLGHPVVLAYFATW